MTEKPEVKFSPYTLRRIRHEVAKSGRIDKAVEEEILALSEDQRVDLFRPAAQCRICQTEGATSVTNKMLSYGATHQDILDVLQPLNLRRPKNEPITLNVIGHHARNHFPLEEAANAVYRKLIEKRAAEAEKDFINGVGGAVTALGFLDVVVQKGYENLVEEDVIVGVDTAIRAAKELATIEAQRDSNDNDIADVMVKMDQVIKAVRDVVPEEMWDQIAARIQGQAPEDRDQHVIEAEVEDYEEPGYDPGDPDLANLEDE